MCRTLADGLQMLDAFIRFVVCDPCSTPAYQHLRLSLMSTLCLKSTDNLPLIHYLLQLIPLLPVVQLYCYQYVSLSNIRLLLQTSNALNALMS